LKPDFVLFAPEKKLDVWWARRLSEKNTVRLAAEPLAYFRVYRPRYTFREPKPRRKGGNCDALQLEAAPSRASRQLFPDLITMQMPSLKSVNLSVSDL